MKLLEPCAMDEQGTRGLEALGRAWVRLGRGYINVVHPSHSKMFRCSFFVKLEILQNDRIRLFSDVEVVTSNFPWTLRSTLNAFRPITTPDLPTTSRTVT
jgi:hypothetical protein